MPKYGSPVSVLQFQFAPKLTQY